MQRYLRATFSHVVWGSLASSLGHAILGGVLPDEPAAIAKPVTGIGDVDSADITTQITALSRNVRSSAE